MKPFVYIVPAHESFLNDKLFELKGFSGEQTREYVLRERIKDRYEVHTIDHFYRNNTSLELIKRIYFQNLIPFSKDLELIERFDSDTLRAIIFEPPAVNPFQYRTRLLSRFGKVYTWRDDWIAERSYQKLNFSVEPTIIAPNIRWSERKLCAMMAGNKISFHPRELYSSRYRFLKAAEKLKLELDLYGPGWNVPHGLAKPIQSFLWQSFQNRSIHLPNKHLSYYLRGRPRYESYHGLADDKSQTFAQYRFVIAIENQYDMPGYFTEKLWEAFMSGAVPVYLGASNVERYVPKDAFIDMREFRSEADVLDYLTTVTEEQFLKIRSAIDSFLMSDTFYQFTHSAYCDQLEADLGQD